MNEETEESVGLDSSLDEMARKGVFLYIERQPSTPSEIYRECFNEDTIYMPDYIMDDLGRLKELRYHKVSNK